MTFDYCEHKIKFIKDEISKGSLDNILWCLETHRSIYVQLNSYRYYSKKKVYSLVMQI